MNDREFLMWLHARLTEVHGEHSLVDYMRKFRAVISSIPENQVTPNDGRGGNNLESLREKCAQQSVQRSGGRLAQKRYRQKRASLYEPPANASR
jgi:hypothetical protein